MIRSSQARWYAILVVGAGLVWGSCTEQIFHKPSCGGDGGCPAGSTCSDGGVCVNIPGDGTPVLPEAAFPDVKVEPDQGCPSSILCGKPAVCCKKGEECIEDKCLPYCPSNVRCLTPTFLCCQTGQVCISGGCVYPGSPCKDSFDCPVNWFCEPTLGRCLPQPTGNKCQVKPKSVTFKPTTEWNWQGYSKDSKFHEVAVAPAVADIDVDGTPEVIFTSYSHSSSSQAMLVVLDGSTGKEELTIPYTTHNFSAWCGVAVGELDSDKQLEIVAVVQGKGVTVFEHDGTLKWSNATGTLAKVASRSIHPHPAISDLDADGQPEIVVAGVALDSKGKVIFDVGTLGANSGWVLSTLADLDEDGKMEVVGGNAAYDHKGKLLWKSAVAPDGLVAVADMDGDGWADVVSVSAGKVRVLRGTAKSGKPAGEVIFGPVAIPGGGVGGPPTVGDFDGDGRPEFSAAGKGKYTVYDLDCKAGAPLTVCPSGAVNGILWSVTTQDISSSVTGSSLFDFEGDGKVEVVYNDECHLYVLDGKTGAQLMKIPNTSRTAAEYPLIADVDGDNNSEFVIPANDDQIVRDKCPPPGTRGIRVFGDSADRWVRTRPVWNQHTYHITNVSATGQVPKSEVRNWDVKVLNNFRQNVQGEGIFNAPDLTVVGMEAYTLGCPKIIELRARVSNIGSLGVKAGIKVTFYQGSAGWPTAILGTVSTTKTLLPGESQLLTVNFVPPVGYLGPFDFWVRVDDDGKGLGGETECNENNNIASITNVTCPLIK